MNLIEQGRAGALDAQCGTNGLGTCVGLAVAVTADFSRWFIAHIDSAARVPSGSGACYDAVRANAAGTAQQLCPHVAGARVYIVTTASDFSSRAIRDGLLDTYGAQTPVSAYDGFYVDATGAIHNLGQGANNVAGDHAFSVPALSPPCP